MAIGDCDIGVPGASDVLAERLRRLISDGALLYETWPTERELAADTQLSRGTVRDAVRVLEAESPVETRANRNGGTVVRRLDASAIVRSLNVVVRGRKIRMRLLLQIRERVEPECAELAAERRTGVLNSEAVVTHAVQAHARIFDAIRVEDSDAARRRMQRHVCAYRDSVMPAAGLRDHAAGGERE